MNDNNLLQKHSVADRMIGIAICICKKSISFEELIEIDSILDKISMIVHKIEKEELA